MKVPIGVVSAIFLSVLPAVAGEWIEQSPRDEIAPEFSREGDVLILKAPQREGVNGWYEKEVSVAGSKWVRFATERLAQGMEYPRRSCVVRIEWYGENGSSVQSARPVNEKYFGEQKAFAKPDFPKDGSPNDDGWVPVEGTLLVPPDAATAKIQLHLRWAPGGEVAWRNVQFEETEAPEKRLVTLAAVHYQLPGNGRTVAENREAFVPLIARAAEKGADLVVLPEYMTCKGVTHDYASVAEPVPGPTTEFLGGLAKEHDCYIVASIPERDRHLVYNAAVLVGPDGELVGKYRKVTLPREEIQSGISPGHDYPVFDTRFGKVGMLICYDVFFPEVARELALNGAEVLALPIWGGNPRLAAARCAENGVYLVTSTYTGHDHDWMKTAVWNREGDRIVEATEWGTVVTATVDLNEPTYWYGLGDFQSRIKREGPVRKAEKPVSEKGVGDSSD